MWGPVWEFWDMHAKVHALRGIQNLLQETYRVADLVTQAIQGGSCGSDCRNIARHSVLFGIRDRGGCPLSKTLCLFRKDSRASRFISPFMAEPSNWAATNEPPRVAWPPGTLKVGGRVRLR